MYYFRRLIGLLATLVLLTGCDTPINSPYEEQVLTSNTYFSSFAERPRFLDPARVYSSDESAFINQIYEPPLQYAYLVRPYRLEPLAAAHMPRETYLDKNMKPLPEDAPAAVVAYTRYEIEIKPNMLYQPHPAFYYASLTSTDLKGVNNIRDFKHTSTRAVTAEDFAYQIKRLADPTINSPIYPFMKDYIVGLEALNAAIVADKSSTPLKDRTLAGVQVIDSTHYAILVQGKYPQFLYWLAMPFFCPMPWEADRFYNNTTLIDRNIVLDWYPVGSGPYYMTENNPNRRMVLEKNPNYHGENYPSEGSPEQVAAGLLKDAGKPLPFIDRAIFTLEKEDIPRWNKFLQGYYDASGLASDNFDQAIQVSNGQASLTPNLKSMGIAMLSETRMADFYWGFNMMDSVVGGYTENNRKLRQAISIAIDTEEYISIFLNERGTPAQSIIPPGIEGYEGFPGGVNPYVYEWENNRLKRRSIVEAQKLLAEAGYPNGIDPKTGRALVIYYDVSSSGDPSQKARFAWMRKQFSKLGINLTIRATDYNRFRQKLENGNAQFFGLGWIADYPDAENFLMILYSPNGKKMASGVNSTNYNSPEYDSLFQQMRGMKSSPQRTQLIEQLIDITQKDAPMVWGYFPDAFLLTQPWYQNVTVSGVAGNTLKYQRINEEERIVKQQQYNQPTFWPAMILFILLLLLILPVWREYLKREKNQLARRIQKT